MQAGWARRRAVVTRTPDGRSVLSLFTGAGGLDLGLEAAGFQPTLCVEIDEDSRETVARNRSDWWLAEPGDIHKLSPDALLAQAGLKPGQLTLLAGGPPCQPFSKSAYWRTGDAQRLRDPRSRTLNAYLDVVRAARPHVLLLENVKGLAYDGKDEALRLLKEGLRLINDECYTSYVPQVINLDAADYGVPQFRERVFIVASIDGTQLRMPPPTHGEGPGRQPYMTVWDAIGDLDVESWEKELNPTGQWAELLPSIPEGKNYLWHTPRNVSEGGMPLFGWRTRYWSFLLKLSKNQPSWTIQAAPGPATGPFHWKSRLLSTRELCRLQTFPEGYEIAGGRRSAQRQLGNAVPSAIGEFFGLEIRRQLLGAPRVRYKLQLLPERRGGCPSPEPLARVARKYLKLRAAHEDHPGPGLGPAARRRGRVDIQA
jgi:DNA (cytosine-5)-methyltransferase 1